MAEEALAQFEVELGLRSPETTKVADTAKGSGSGSDENHYNRND